MARMSPSLGSPERMRPGREFGEALEDGFVEGAGDAGGGAGDDEVDAGVAGVGEFVGEYGQGVVGAGGDEVVVVEEDEEAGAGPPAAVAELLGGDVGGGPTAFHEPARAFMWMSREPSVGAYSRRWVSGMASRRVRR